MAVGNGQVIYSQGKCEDVSLSVQGNETLETFLLFELGSAWLRTLGETHINWGLHTLHYKVIVGDSELLRVQISLNALDKCIEADLVSLLELFFAGTADII